MFFILATTTWILTLLVNLNPLMRFDGYFVLSDVSGVENLQQRSFDLAKWRIREALFGFGFPPLEPVNHKLIVFAIATWIYRFFLYLGIALIIYSYFFKVLGLALIVLQLGQSIGLPLYRESRFWLQNRASVRFWPNGLLSVVGVFVLLVWFFLPSQSLYRAPAFVQSQNLMPVVAQEAGLLKALHVAQGDTVEPSQLLVEVSYPDLEFERAQTQREIVLLQSQLANQGVGFSEDRTRETIISELAAAKLAHEELTKRLMDGQIYATHAGLITIPSAAPDLNQWFARGTPLMLVSGQSDLKGTAYAKEREVEDIEVGMSGWLYLDGGVTDRLPLTVTSVEPVAVSALTLPYVASLYGGGLPVKQNEEMLQPVSATYRFDFSISGLQQGTRLDLTDRVYRGTAVVESPPVSWFQRGLAWMQVRWRREAGF